MSQMVQKNLEKNLGAIFLTPNPADRADVWRRRSSADRSAT